MLQHNDDTSVQVVSVINETSVFMLYISVKPMFCTLPVQSLPEDQQVLMTSFSKLDSGTTDESFISRQLSFAITSASKFSFG